MQEKREVLPVVIAVQWNKNCSDEMFEQNFISKQAAETMNNEGWRRAINSLYLPAKSPRSILQSHIHRILKGFKKQWQFKFILQQP